MRYRVIFFLLLLLLLLTFPFSKRSVDRNVSVVSVFPLQYPTIAAFALRLVTYVGVAASLAVLLLAFILFLVLR